MGKLFVGNSSALAGAIGADELFHFRLLTLSHLWLDIFCPYSAHILSWSPSEPPVWMKKKQHHLNTSLNTWIYSRSGTSPWGWVDAVPVMPSLCCKNLSGDTPYPKAKVWSGQAGGGDQEFGAGRGHWFLVFPKISQNRKAAASHYCLMLGRNEPDSKSWRTFLGSRRSRGHQTLPFLLPPPSDTCPFLLLGESLGVG